MARMLRRDGPRCSAAWIGLPPTSHRPLAGVTWPLLAQVVLLSALLTLIGWLWQASDLDGVTFAITRPGSSTCELLSAFAVHMRMFYYRLVLGS